MINRFQSAVLGFNAAFIVLGSLGWMIHSDRWAPWILLGGLCGMAFLMPNIIAIVWIKTKSVGRIPRVKSPPPPPPRRPSSMSRR